MPLLGNILQLAATVLICGPAAPLCAAVVATIASTAIAGITSGNLGTALRAGIITAFTAGAFFAAGELTGNFSGTQTPGNGHGVLQFGSDAHLFNIAAHATVGCAASVASGGRCGSGALSGAVGSFAGPLLKDLAFGPKLVATSVLGGLASMAGGGSFGNGAVTAAFGYLFNEGGRGPNDRHKLAVAEAVRYAFESGYEILSDSETLAQISGQPNKKYDFVIRDPGTVQVIGAEVKSSWWGIIKLNQQQVDFDVNVASGVSAFAPSLGVTITGAQYYTYCFMCGLPGGLPNVSIGSLALWSRLKAQNIDSIPVR